MKIDELQKAALLDPCPTCRLRVDHVIVEVRGSGAFQSSETWAEPCGHYVTATKDFDYADDRHTISLEPAPSYLAGLRHREARTLL